MASGSTNPRDTARLKRKKRIRRKMEGTQARPRLTVFRSDKHIYAQIINDETGATLVSASTLSPEYREMEAVKGKDHRRQARWGTRCRQSHREGYRQGRFRPQRLYLPRTH